MIPWWMRLILSLASTLIGACAGGAFLETWSLLEPNAHFQLVDLFWSAFVVLAFGIPGWLLATPIVLSVTNFRGWRTGFYLALGTCIGPVVVLGQALFESLGNPRNDGHWADRSWGLAALAAGVSCVTTLAYLALFERASLHFEGY